MLAPAAARKARREPSPVAWQTIVLPRDRARLRDWREAWRDGLAQARAAGFGIALDREGALLDPDAGMNDPAAPDGAYRCRTIKLGRKAGPGAAFSTPPPFACRIANGRFEALEGPQRPSGTLWPYDGPRLLFLGAVSLGDEQAKLPYGRDVDRDSVGLLERIGAARWRLVLPRPRWESEIDVIEILPAGE